MSLLTGKVFDETGDWLTPSHTKTAKGCRLRYYISHRLIRSAGKKDAGGWRLPGPELESTVAKLIAGYLNNPEVAARRSDYSGRNQTSGNILTIPPEPQ